MKARRKSEVEERRKFLYRILYQLECISYIVMGFGGVMKSKGNKLSTIG
jgi:hypothetical protein